MDGNVNLSDLIEQRAIVDEKLIVLFQIAAAWGRSSKPPILLQSCQNGNRGKFTSTHTAERLKLAEVDLNVFFMYSQEKIWP